MRPRGEAATKCNIWYGYEEKYVKALVQSRLYSSAKRTRSQTVSSQLGLLLQLGLLPQFSGCATPD